jgi:hypothetical protein
MQKLEKNGILAHSEGKNRKNTSQIWHPDKKIMKRSAVSAMVNYNFADYRMIGYLCL